MSQKRCVMCISLQPSSTKWLCSGDILNSRLPPVRFEICHLQHHRAGFRDKDDADDREQQPLTGHQRDRAERRADRDRAGAAHKHFRRVGVKPQERQDRAYHRETERAQPALSLQERDDRVRRERHGSGGAGQAVETVGHVYGVRAADDKDHGNRQPQQAQFDLLPHARNGDAAQVRRAEIQHGGDDECQQDLDRKLLARQQPALAVARPYAQIIVDRPKDAEGDQRKQRHDDRAPDEHLSPDAQ